MNTALTIVPSRLEPRAKPSRKRTWNALLGSMSLALALLATSVQAETYPTHVISLIVPFTSGGGADVVTRMVAEQLEPKLGQNLIVENRPGASAGIGAALVAKAEPDGYSLLVGSATLAASAVVDGGSKNFDLMNDFEYISKMGKLDLIIVVPSQSKIQNLDDLVKLMRTNPDEVQFGSPGIGSPAHLGGELLKLVTKSDALHVPYKGESAALVDLLGGRMTFQLCAPFVCAPRIKDGTLRGLAVTGTQRSKLTPDIPTTVEAGVPGVEAGTWYFLAAPKGTPAAIITKLNIALNEVLADEKFGARLLSMGVEVEPGVTPAAVKSALQAEMDKWRPVVQAAGITK